MSSWAITSPLVTLSLKSTESLEIMPDTWVPTSTIVTASRVPVADTTDSRFPFSTPTKRYCFSLPDPRRANPAHATATTATTASSTMIIFLTMPSRRTAHGRL